MLQGDEETDLAGLFSRILEDVYFMFVKDMATY